MHCVLKINMNKRLYNVLATVMVLQIVNINIPTTSFADSVENVVTGTKITSSDIEAIKSIEDDMRDEDGKGDKIDENGEIQGNFIVNIQKQTTLYDSPNIQSTVTS
ncbi:hypothetical protein [Bacillus mycoides]|nr:hypothetical protein [Bacillus mycoides]